ncbi:MAG TPA: hypothetical protein VNL98_13000 [Gemmatimonadales bacterium]|nr:hypothetical protein [Gemmatimonadales bacterium]
MHYIRKVHTHAHPNAGGLIRIFGVGLLAVAAVAAAGFLWRRRREELIVWSPERPEDERLVRMRRAGL